MADTKQGDSTESHGVGGPAYTVSWSAAAVLLLRLMAVSHWNWHTAFDVADVVDFSDAISIVYGTLFAEPTYTSILVMLLLPLVVLRIVWPVSNPHPLLSASASVMLLVAVLTCTIALVVTYDQWWLLVGSFAIAAMLVAGRIIWRRGGAHAIVMRILRSTAATAGVGGLLLAAAVTEPWTPREHIETDSQVVDGYTLKVEPGYLKVLTTKDRQVKIISNDEVKFRSQHPAS